MEWQSEIIFGLSMRNSRKPILSVQRPKLNRVSMPYSALTCCGRHSGMRRLRQYDVEINYEKSWLCRAWREGAQQSNFGGSSPEASLKLGTTNNAKSSEGLSDERDFDGVAGVENDVAEAEWWKWALRETYGTLSRIAHRSAKNNKGYRSWRKSEKNISNEIENFFL